MSPDGTRIAVASSIGLWLYDAATLAEIALFTGPTNDVYDVYSVSSFAGWSDVGQQCQLGRRNGSFVGCLHRSGRGRPRRTYGQGLNRCPFSPNGQTLASGSWDRDGSFVGCVHRSAKGRPRRTHAGLSNSVSFSPDGQMLASGSLDRNGSFVGCVHRSAKGRPRRT